MIKLNKNSTEEEVRKVFTLEVGSVFKVENQYEGEWETITKRIFEDFYPKGSTWNAVAITPGTELYTTYGPDHFVVTDSDVTEQTNDQNG